VGGGGAAGVSVGGGAACRLATVDHGNGTDHERRCRGPLGGRPVRLGSVARVARGHRTAPVAPVDGIPSTNPIRTLLDLGGQLPRPVFEDVLDTAVVQGRVRVDRLERRARELWTPRRNGCAVVLDLLEARHPDLIRAANLWEAKVVRVVRSLRMPDPKINHRVRAGERVRYLDLAWPEAKVAVEFDGFVPHSMRRVFDDDRARQNDLVDDDWSVFRVTKTMLDADPVGTFRPIAAKVARNSPHAVKNACDQERIR
jgi:very-short-patch-repair endonuclease